VKLAASNDLRNVVQRWLRSILRDPVVGILLKTSHLTPVQLETLLIDLLAESVAGKPIRFEDKALLRVSRGPVSRGAFNRTLRQARRNVVRSLYTVMLLGYLGVLESPRLEPYLEVGGRLKTYVDAYRGAESDEERRRLLELLGRELGRTLRRLSEPRALSKKSYA